MRRDPPRVSIGLPVFNGEKFIEQALDSIQAQTFSDFELIISDNASTDKTQEICQAYATQDARIRYFRNDINVGAAPNFNRAFDLASGEYFKWMAHDDLIAPNFLSCCVEVLDQHPDVILCYSRVKLVDENGSFINDYNPEPDTRTPNPHDRFRNLLFIPHLWIQVFGLIRADAIKTTAKIGSYPGSDTVFVADLALRGRFYEIPERLFFSRIHSEQSIKGSLTVERDRTVWFDTSMAGRIVLPKWQYLFGYLKAINKAPIRRYERMRCYAQMGRWVLIPPHFRALGKDMLLAARHLVVRTLFKPEKTQQLHQKDKKSVEEVY